MRNVVQIGIECEQNLAAIGIKCGRINRYKVNSRATRRLGQCSGNEKIGFTIEIAEVLLGEDIPMEELRNTMFHELLHTCKDCMNHGSEWQRLADKTGRTYGLNIGRLASSDEKATQIMLKAYKENAKYKYVCENCGRMHIQHRASNFTRHPESYRCGRCQTVGRWKRVD